MRSGGNAESGVRAEPSAEQRTEEVNEAVAEVNDESRQRESLSSGSESSDGDEDGEGSGSEEKTSTMQSAASKAPSDVSDSECVAVKEG